MSRRPHEHYLIDQVGPSIWAVICATCEERYGYGTVGLVDCVLDYPRLAQLHWDEEVLGVRRERTRSRLWN